MKLNQNLTKLLWQSLLMSCTKLTNFLKVWFIKFMWNHFSLIAFHVLVDAEYKWRFKFRPIHYLLHLVKRCFHGHSSTRFLLCFCTSFAIDFNPIWTLHSRFVFFMKIISWIIYEISMTGQCRSKQEGVNLPVDGILYHLWPISTI